MKKYHLHGKRYRAEYKRHQNDDYSASDSICDCCGVVITEGEVIDFAYVAYPAPAQRAFEFVVLHEDCARKVIPGLDDVPLANSYVR